MSAYTRRFKSLESCQHWSSRYVRAIAFNAQARTVPTERETQYARETQNANEKGRTQDLEVRTQELELRTQDQNSGFRTEESEPKLRTQKAELRTQNLELRT